MSSYRWKEIRARFDELVALKLEQRAARLAALRNTDPEIHREVVRLLEADRGARGRLERFRPPGAEPGPSLHQRIRAEMREELETALGSRYRIEEELGRGGTAVVFRAREIGEERAVAMKVLEPDVGRALGHGRFLQEIRIVRKLRHPCVVPVLESGEAGTLLYYVMPLIQGESLRALLNREGALAPGRTLGVVADCAAALEYAHEEGVIHRDVKPANILLADEGARLADFGVARAVDRAAGERLTETGVSLGTVGYMSPEQATARKGVDGRADVYGLAGVAYEMLAGEPAFVGRTAREILKRQMTERPRPLSAASPGLPKRVDGVMERALHRDPDSRYATPEGFARALREAVAGAD